MDKIILTKKAYELVAKCDARRRRLLTQSQLIHRILSNRSDAVVNPFVGDITAHISGESFDSCQKQYEGN